MISTEGLGAGHSFAVAIAAHTGIGTLPIVYYGNDAQKAKYLPKLSNGEWKACYCLTEPGSGSDANAAKTKATLSTDGKHYILNGQKMWITNAGFAEVFIVFAKIDSDENLSAFIVEKSFGGITLNPEEHKMGIKGSSTRQVFFSDCRVPVENLLSERQNGFKIAVNILNVGRLKLAGAAVGGSKEVVTQATRYANERQQFGRPIAKYGAIRYKLAEMAIRIYAVESDVDDTKTYPADSRKDWSDVGEVNDVVLDWDGSIKAVVLGVGGFLGVGEKDVAIEMSSLRRVRESSDSNDWFLVVNSSKDLLSNAPAYAGNVKS